MAIFDVGDRVDFELGICQLGATVISQEDYSKENDLPPDLDDYVYLKIHDYMCNLTIRDKLSNRMVRVKRTILPRLIAQGGGP